MFTLFSQEYNTEAYVREREVKSAIEMCQDFGSSMKETINKIAEKFNLSKDIAAGYVKEFCENNTEGGTAL